MKIGDKVRYLNDVGEGIVTKIDEKGIVIVLEDDGFQTPMMAKELVVIDETDKFNFRLKQKKNEQEKEELQEKEKYFFDEKDELPEGEKLTIFIAFVPYDIKHLQTSSMKMFLVNESNYFIRFQILKSGQKSVIYSTDTIEPQTKLHISDIKKDEVNDFEFLRFQGYVFKANKPFEMKPAIDIELRVNPVDFFKLHKFKENDFFDEKSMLLTILENDFSSIESFINAEQLQNAMQDKKFQPTKKVFAQPKKSELIEIDLHIQNLIDNFNNLSNHDMLEIQITKFNDVMKENINKKGQKIVFIHGKGEGVLRNEIYNNLKKNYKKASFQDASFSKYGFGATQVTIH